MQLCRFLRILWSVIGLKWHIVMFLVYKMQDFMHR